MTFINIFLLEWKHFIRSPYKVIAISLFILASVYGIHNSVSLYQTQINEIAKIFEGEYLSTSTANPILEMPDVISKDEPANDISLFLKSKLVIKPCNHNP